MNELETVLSVKVQKLNVAFFFSLRRNSFAVIKSIKGSESPLNVKKYDNILL